MIEFSNVVLRYLYDDFDLLKGVSFSLVDGVNTVVCDVQSGKSSLCNLLCGEVKPTSGNVYFDGKDILGITNKDRGILYLSSNPPFFLNKTVRQNVEYPLAVRKTEKSQRLSIAEQAMQTVGIADLAKVKAKKLDEKQKIAVMLARGLTVSRKVVLFDGILDGGNVGVTQTLNLFDSPVKVIFTSKKDLLMGNVIVLDGGKCVYQGDADGAKTVLDGLAFLSEKTL